MRRWIGPGILVAVGYMDPGNWATGIEAGSGYGYVLGWVILLSSASAMLLQVAAARLGLFSGHDLIGLGYLLLGQRVGKILALTALLAVMATDLAEVLGFALALRLLFKIPLEAGAVLALIETVLVLSWTARRPHLLEKLVGILTFAVIGIFIYELIELKPSWKAVFQGFLPSGEILHDREALYLALGLIGATIMPHNLYLHSAWVQGRFFGEPAAQARLTARDTAWSLSLAFFVNASLLITAAALCQAPDPLRRWGIEQAYVLFEPVAGPFAASAFAIALLFSGHNATLTTTLTGQIVLGYLLPTQISAFWRGLLLRSLSLFPALAALFLWGERHLSAMLVFSQVFLSLQLPFVLLPMLYFFVKVKRAAFGHVGQGLTWLISLTVVALNLYLLLSG
ncbi:MAG: Nramp family divalent metal transporter [Bacteroidia bacterium]|nr:Nramp family divalent metal transporter [Bacteroidia bacterium]MDW8015431.1 Nramp family divalent metal transporter [Bacteroidia bacterium]